MPINAADIPEGLTATPHPIGAGFKLDPKEVNAYQPPTPPDNTVRLLPEAEIIAGIYRELMDGSTVGVSAGMGGMLPEKLLWTTIEAYAHVQRVKLNRWVTTLLHSLDGVRLNAEFARLKKDAAKKT